MEYKKTSKDFIEKFYLSDKADFDANETGTITATYPKWMIKRLDDEARNIGISRSRLMAELIEIALDDIDYEWQTTYKASKGRKDK